MWLVVWNVWHILLYPKHSNQYNITEIMKFHFLLNESRTQTNIRNYVFKKEYMQWSANCIVSSASSSIVSQTTEDLEDILI